MVMDPGLDISSLQLSDGQGTAVFAQVIEDSGDVFFVPLADPSAEKKIGATN